MRLLPPATVAALALLGGLLAPAYADPSRPAPTLPAPASEQAVEALEEAQAALAGETTTTPTTALVELSQAVDELPVARRDEARALLARPDGTPTPADTQTGATYDSFEQEAAQRICGPHVCLHYVPESADNVLLTRDHGADPSWAAGTLNVLNHVWQRVVANQGWRAPLPDGAEGGDSRLDVYLADIGDDGYYGYAVPERDDPISQAYLVLDEDFAEFHSTPLVSLQATAAHEFFHAVQFAYDTYEAVWFMESTATYMEEQVFDGANDSRAYLQESSLRHPGLPLDGDRTVYGNWVFWQFLAERFGAPLVKDVWNRAAAPGPTVLPALSTSLAVRGTSLRHMFSTFSVVNNVPARVYSEGSAFPTATVAGRWVLENHRRGTGDRSLRLDHLSSQNHVFVPGRSLPGFWWLRIWVNGPSNATETMVLVHLRNGRIRWVRIGLNAAGDGTTRVAFAPGSVSHVTMNLGNVSNGADNQPFRFSAHATR